METFLRVLERVKGEKVAFVMSSEPCYFVDYYHCDFDNENDPQTFKEQNKAFGKSKPIDIDIKGVERTAKRCRWKRRK